VRCCSKGKCLWMVAFSSPVRSSPSSIAPRRATGEIGDAQGLGPDRLLEGGPERVGNARH